MTDPSAPPPTIGTNAPEARALLKAHFESGSHAQHPALWDALWAKGDFIPWDKGFANPALVDTLVQRADLLGASTVVATTTTTAAAAASKGRTRRKRALVPGCGKGYDVLLLASFGYDAYGLEVSEHALKAARALRESEGDKYVAREPDVGMGSVGLVSGDFFADAWVAQTGLQEGGGFDLIYDYTFLSALPTEMRPAWSARMAQLLAADGRLICVEFPTYKDPHSGGPPWALPPIVYLAHLSRPGEELPYTDEGLPAEQEQSDKALKRIAHWQPERTHEIGKGTDWVSVWSH